MRLIDADALFKAFERSAWYNNADRDEIAEEILWQMPTIDAVPVVRCKECKHMAVVGVGFRWCKAWERMQTMGDDGFCCFGERRSDD